MYFPLLPQQKGILYEVLKEQDSSPIYNVQLLIQLEGEIDPNVFWHAWQIVFDQYGILRGSIDVSASHSPLLYIHPACELPKKQIDISALPEDAQRDILDTYLLDDRRKPFELSKPPLLRLSLIKHSRTRFSFIWTMHHILLDFSHSSATLLESLFEIYHALSRHENIPVSCIRDYGELLAEQAKFDARTTHKYWQALLAGLTEVMPLPLEHAFSNNQSPVLQKYTFEIGSEHFHRGKVYLAQTNFSWNTVILTAWAKLLSFYTGGKDTIFGTVRAYPAQFVNGHVGLLLNTLPIVMRFDQARTLLEQLHSVREQQRKIRDYIFTPLSDIASLSGIPSGEDLFHSIVDFKPYRALRNPSDISIVGEIDITVETNYPLVLEVSDCGDTLSCKLCYAETHFTESAISQLAEHFSNLLKQIIETKGQALNDREILSDREKHILLHQFNQTEIPKMDVENICTAFDKQATVYPDKIALIGEGRHLIYQEMNQKANAVAAYLSAQHFQPESVVGIFMRRGCDLMIAILGVLKAGLAYTPIDPNLSAEGIDYQIRDSALVVLLIEEIYRERVERILQGTTVLAHTMEAIDAKVDSLSYFHVFPKILPQQLAYIIYTSGTTGYPKGVMVEHGAVLNMARSHIDVLHISPDSRVLQYAAPQFDVSVAEWAMALLSGATLCLLPKEGCFVGAELISFLAEAEITVALVTGSVLKHLPHVALDKLETLVVGGEVCTENAISFWSKGRRFVNAFGLTETTVCCCFSVNTSSPTDIGFPIANTKAYVLNDALTLLPIGAIGELCVSGACLARGYKNKPDLTQERFVPHPYAAGEMLFKTGDLVKRRSDGGLDYFGRKDKQLKIRGYRIEPDAIANTICQHEKVANSVVTGETTNAGEKELVAYIVSLEETASAEEIKVFLQKKFPTYMIPACYVLIDALPLTRNGKIDTDRLHQLYLSSAALEKQTQASDASKNVSEQFEAAVSAIWKRLLHVKTLSLTKNLFDLGANSFLLLEASTELSRIFNKRIEIVDLFHYPTIVSFCDFLREQRITLKTNEALYTDHK